MPWLEFPITDELIGTFQHWITWCYLFCQEHEGIQLWLQTLKFYDENQDLKVPLPTYEMYLQERGYHEGIDAPPSPFFKDCGEVLGKTKDFITGEEF